jgi:hypothetical protein
MPHTEPERLNTQSLTVSFSETHSFTSSVGCRDAYKLFSSKGLQGRPLVRWETSKSLGWRVQVLPRGQPH